MHRYIARANVDHYLGILCGTNLTPQHRSTAMESWPRLFGQRPAGFKWIPAGLC